MSLIQQVKARMKYIHTHGLYYRKGKRHDPIALLHPSGVIRQGRGRDSDAQGAIVR